MQGAAQEITTANVPSFHTVIDHLPEALYHRCNTLASARKFA